MARIPDNGRYGYPALRTNSVRAWYLADTAQGNEFYDAVGGYLIAGDNSGQTVLPYVVDSPAGKARSFKTGSGQGLWGPIPATLPEGDRLAALGDWTLSYLVRHMSDQANASHVALVGEQGDGVPAENYMFQAKSANGNPVLFWEWDDGTSQTTLTAGNYAFPLYEWVMVTWRKRNTTLTAAGLPIGGLIDNGGGGTCDFELLINGRVVESGLVAVTDPRYNAAFSGNTNTDGGQSTIWTIGGMPTAAFAGVIQTPDADIDGVFFYGDPLSDKEIQNDVRRWQALSGHSRAALRVTTEDQSGNKVDLTDLDGVDFVTKADITDELDQAVMTANVELVREQKKESIATLVTNAQLNLSDQSDPASYVAPFIDLGRGIEIFSARVPLGIDPDARDWFSVFKGNIDEIQEGSDSMSLVCRDIGGILLDTFIETERDYSDPVTPFAVEGEMQFILDDNDNTGITGSYDPVTLYTPVSPSWAVLGWRQRREPVMSALRTLAGQIGADVRYKFDQDPEGPPSWRLTFEIPDRERLDANIVLAEEDILDVTNLSRTLLGIRNVVRVVYTSSELTIPSAPTPPTGILLSNSWSSVDGEQNRLTAYIELEDSASITRVGRRLFMECAEASSSQIDTLDEAYDMALGMLTDLSEEDLAKSISLPLMPEMSINDLVLMQPNRELFTVDQRLAVKRISHTFDGNGPTSTVELRGKPAVGQKRWMRLDTRAGGGKPAVVDPDEALTDQVLGSLLGGVRNFLDRTSYFQGGKFLAIRNPNFQSFSNGMAHPPDGWTPSSVYTGLVTGGGSALRMYTSDDSTSGNWSVGIDPTDGTLSSDLIPVDLSGFSPFGVEVVWKTTNIGTDAVLELRWFDSDKNPVSPYSTQHSNRGLHPSVRSAPYLSPTRDARITVGTTGLGGGSVELITGIVESVRFSVGDVVDYTVDGATPDQDTRRGIVTAFDTNGGGAGVPSYTIEAPAFDVALNGASSTLVDGGVAYRPPLLFMDGALGANTWHTTRQTGIEAPSPDCRFVQVVLGAANSTAGDIRFDAISLFRVGREMRITRPVPTAQVYPHGAWSHSRHASPSAAPYSGTTLFRNGLDYGDNFRTDAFPNPTGNTGVYFLAKEDGLLEIKAQVAGKRPGATVRSRLRILKNETYSDSAGGYAPDGVGEILAYGPWADSTQQVGLPIADAAVALMVDRIPVSQGDRITLEVYFDTSTAATIQVIENPEMNFVHFKLFTNF
jgi:hypothetical protein